MATRRSGGLIEEELTHSVIGAFFRVHRKLGFGFLEQIYAAALELELLALGHRVVRELEVTIYYDGVPIGRQRLDMVVDDKLIVEIKSPERLHRDAGRSSTTGQVRGSSRSAAAIATENYSSAKGLSHNEPGFLGGTTAQDATLTNRLTPLSI